MRAWIDRHSTVGKAYCVPAPRGAALRLVTFHADTGFLCESEEPEGERSVIVRETNVAPQQFGICIAIAQARDSGNRRIPKPWPHRGRSTAERRAKRPVRSPRLGEGGWQTASEERSGRSHRPGKRMQWALVSFVSGWPRSTANP
jgi:hypothetical protein